MIQLIWLIPILPLLGFIITGLGRNILSKNLASIIACATIFGSFIISVGLFFGISAVEGQSITQTYFDWISVGSLHLPFAFMVDSLTCVMLLIITGVGLLIHIYSAGYMHHDAGQNKFFAYLNLFVFFMLILVLGASYPVMFIGWEGVGLCSYLLIGFWYNKDAYNDAAKKAFIINRIGDLGLLLGLFLIFTTFGSLNFGEVFTAAKGVSTVNTPMLVAITLLLFVGATGKSAQLPLFTWLPDAMAGPTPVSALIHAATMVTAGLYMIARSNILFALAPCTMEIIAIVGAVTALFSALIALTQTDIKKVLAYSTVSQLGFMFAAMGVGAFTGGMFHVMTHAFFKALLFLGAGSVIHAMSDEQDIRNMGGLRKKLPITFITFAIGTIAIAGIPPFAGFFSKDEILAHTFVHNKFVYILLAITSLLTAVYMFRLFFLTFFGKFRGTEAQAHHLHESPMSMTFPLVVLAILSTVGGFLGLPEIFSEHHALKSFLAPVFEGSAKLLPEVVISHSTELTIMVSALIAAVGAMIYAYFKYAKADIKLASDAEISGLAKVSYNKFYVDELYNAIVTKPLDKLSDIFYKTIDIRGIDGVVNSTGTATNWMAGTLRHVQSGNTGFYMFLMVAGIIAMFVVGLFVL